MRRSLPVVLALVLASAAHASGGDSREDELEVVFDMVWHAVNLALLVGVIVYFGRRPIQAYFAERRDGIRQSLESSTRLLEEAEARLAEWQGRLDRLDGEIEEIRTATHRLAEAERERILADARASAERVRQDAAAAVDQEVRRARAVLREEAADLSVDLAERMLRDQVRDEDRTRLLDEFVERVGRAPSQPDAER
ncbi:MAG: F0F1 ATP synthase subunit B [Myxococcota bacterium]